jgi:hypothetical protein
MHNADGQVNLFKHPLAIQGELIYNQKLIIKCFCMPHVLSSKFEHNTCHEFMLN